MKRVVNDRQYIHNQEDVDNWKLEINQIETKYVKFPSLKINSFV